MYPVSALFKTYIALPERQFETRAMVGATMYDSSKVVKFVTDDSIIPSEELLIGSVIASKLVISIKTSDAIPPNAKITPAIRLNGSGGWTEWVPLSDFFVDSRSFENDVWTFTCYDALVTTEQDYVSTLVFPIAMKTVFDEIVTQLGFTVDASVVINPAYTIDFNPEGEFSLRAMLGYIASAHGASVRINKAGKLAFVHIVNSGAVAQVYPAQYIKAEKKNNVKTITRIVLTYNKDGEFLVAGSGDADHTLNIYNPFVNETMLADLMTKFNGYSYTPFTMDWRGDPSVEVGDLIYINLRDGSSIPSTVLVNKMSLISGLKMTTEAPGYSAQRSEFDFKGTLRKYVQDLSKSAVKLEQPYFGVTIGRANGLKIVKSDGTSEVVFNSDKLAMRAGGVDRVYFDPIEGKYIFDGLLSATALEAVKANIDVVVSNVTITNVLAAQTGYIAQLTVDQLETSDKVQRYLVSDTTDVNYVAARDQTIEWITAQTDGLATEQAKDRSGAALYWVDATKKGITHEVTELPVTIYVYEEFVKRKISFEPVGGDYIPVDQLGAGTGVGDRGKAFIRKILDGLEVEYISTTGQSRKIKLTDAGIIQEGNTGSVGLRNIAIGNVAPVLPQFNDLWIDTTA